jgi:hypothetical protein
MGLPVLRASPSCVHAIATTPAQRLGAFLAHFPSRFSLPRIGERVGLRNVLFEACSAFTHVTACTLAKSPKVTLYTEGFSHFVTSMTAPIATGWSESCRVGFSPTEKRRLSTAHAQKRTLTTKLTSLCEAQRNCDRVQCFVRFN